MTTKSREVTFAFMLILAITFAALQTGTHALKAILIAGQ